MTAMTTPDPTPITMLMKTWVITATPRHVDEDLDSNMVNIPAYYIYTLTGANGVCTMKIWHCFPSNNKYSL
jgi:hypothetical protein